MPRELTNIEIESFLSRHPAVRLAVKGPEVMVAASNYTYPRAGVSVKESSGGYVHVWRDAAKRWHFIDLSDMQDWGRVANKPPYYSPDSSLLESLMHRLEELAPTVPDALDWVPWVIGGLLALEVVRTLRR